MKTAIQKAPSWSLELRKIIKDLACQTGTTEKEVASALGFPKHLSRSTITEYDTWHGRLCSAFAIQRLPIVAARLGLGPARYSLAEDFFEEAVCVLLGYPVDARNTRAEQRATADWEAAGSEAYARGKLTVAEAFLSQAWTNLCDGQSTGSDEKLLLRLTVGRQLLSINALLGTTSSVLLVLREVDKMALKAIRYLKTEEILSTAGAALTQVAVAHRLIGRMSGSDVAGFSQMGYKTLAQLELDLPAQLCGLRDQAKPLLASAFQTTDRERAKSFTDRAENVLVKADDLAGGRHPREELREAWLQTRLIKIQRLVLVGTPDAAYREWEVLRSQTWLGGFLKQKARQPILASVQTTEMAVAAGRRHLDELGQLAQSFRSAPENASYGHRLHQVSNLEHYAVCGDLTYLRQALLE